MNLQLPPAAMHASLAGHFATIFIFILVGFAFAWIALVLARILRPSNPHPAKLTTYECGELPRGSSWVRFNVRFYLIALFFLVFDVEVIFLFPWAVVFKPLLPHPQLGKLVFWEMMIFLAILAFGLAYIWAKGDLHWVKKLMERPRGGVAEDGLEDDAREQEVPTT